MIAYLDTSCAVALLKREQKSQEITDYLEEWTDDGHLLVAGELLATELNRVAIRFGIEAQKVQGIIEALNLVAHTSSDFRVAGQLPGGRLGSLDALHLATALRIGVDALLSDDTELVSASEAAGIPVLDTSLPAREL
ncbi:MAG: PIN domain-containing protein [Actinomycetota bacterium]|jgi:predicted nucleic acid-binding protein|nr:PIN domain-containing protein [Actinomycetota bacterium]